MSNKIKLSFKKDKKPTGLHSVGHLYPETFIKVDGKRIGEIIPPSWNTTNTWKILIAVKKTKPDDNPNCDWKWANIGKQFDTESEAREWLKTMIKSIDDVHTFHFFEE